MVTKTKVFSIFSAALLSVFFLCPVEVGAQTEPEDGESGQVFRAMVIEVVEERTAEYEDGSRTVQQKLLLEGLSDGWRGRQVTHDGSAYEVISSNSYAPGDKVIVMRNVDLDGEESFFVIDYVRSGAIFWLALLFAGVVVLIGRLKGLRAILVLILTFGIILKFIIPQILNGHNPVVVALLGSLAILLLAIYVTEGFNRRSHLAILSIGISLLITGLCAVWFVDWVRLTGFESEDVMYLVSSGYGAINVKGLLLAGIMIGTLGVLDDVVISQVSVVEQLKLSNARLSRRETYRKAMKVGVSHLSSMVNTLFLAYAGASLPLLMLFGINDLAPLGFGQIISNEMLATEIVRSLVGSMGLVLAVPISTLLAVYAINPKEGN
jgi:uncharacterized membrane protein